MLDEFVDVRWSNVEPFELGWIVDPDQLGQVLGYDGPFEWTILVGVWHHPHFEALVSVEPADEAHHERDNETCHERNEHTRCGAVEEYHEDDSQDDIQNGVVADDLPDAELHCHEEY